jgi:hypothetical protein
MPRVLKKICIVITSHLKMALSFIDDSHDQINKTHWLNPEPVGNGKTQSKVDCKVSLDDYFYTSNCIPYSLESHECTNWVVQRGSYENYLLSLPSKHDIPTIYLSSSYDSE